MVITDNVGNIVQDLDVILRTHIGEGKVDPSKLFRNPDTSEKAVRSTVFIAINGPFYSGDALVEILEYLESRYNLDFDRLEENYKNSKNE